jgi:hypothetical protein
MSRVMSHGDTRVSRLSVEIGTLTLDSVGSAAGSDPRLAPLVEHALQRLIERHGVPSRIASGNVDEFVMPSATVPAGVASGPLAETIAVAIYRALGGKA